MSEQSGRWKPGTADYLVMFALYAIVLVLSYFLFFVWYAALRLLVGEILEPGSTATRSAIQGVLLILALPLFIFVFSAYYYLQGGLNSRRRQLGRRFARITVPMVVLIALGMLLQMVLRE
jgi:uncharacterized RDD family membrane protein YckC